MIKVVRTMHTSSPTILQETNQWLAIDKPHSWIVERNPFESSTAEDWANDYLSQKHRKYYLGIIHRLDRVTCGVLLLAKKKSTLKDLNRQFAERKITKAYRAWVEGTVEANEGTLSHHLEKDFKNKKALILNKKNKSSKLAELTFKVKERKADKTLLDIYPTTGRFHQIRAQLAAIDHPIIGDEKYGGKIPYAKNAIALQAFQLEFWDSIKAQKVVLESRLTLNFNIK